jgi:triacylglycerol lipase
MKIPTYPVILVHGMMVKDLSVWPAFRGIVDILRQQGISVYVTNQDGLGTVENNARQLKEEIMGILQKENCQKVNIIAHSKGGLDARYMISKLDMGTRTASLTTLSTPHRGSGLSGRLLKMPGFLAKGIAFFSNAGFRFLGDKQPDIYRLGQELTPQAMEAFNKTVMNAPEVYYQSFSSDVQHKKAFLKFIPYRISRYCEQDATDGLVSVTSSQWGEYQGSVEPNVDHLQMVGVYGSQKKLQPVGQFYLHVIEKLADMGF